MDSLGELNMENKPVTQFATNCVRLKLRKKYEINATGEHEHNKECSCDKVDEETDRDEISQSDNKSLKISQCANIQILSAELESDKCPTSLEHETMYNKNGNDGPSKKESFDATDVAPGDSNYRVERTEDISGKYARFCVVRIPLVKLGFSCT